jgi:hypothetical protein
VIGLIGLAAAFFLPRTPAPTATSRPDRTARAR